MQVGNTVSYLCPLAYNALVSSMPLQSYQHPVAWLRDHIVWSYLSTATKTWWRRGLLIVISTSCQKSQSHIKHLIFQHTFQKFRILRLFLPEQGLWQLTYFHMVPFPWGSWPPGSQPTDQIHTALQTEISATIRIQAAVWHYLWYKPTMVVWTGGRKVSAQSLPKAQCSSRKNGEAFLNPLPNHCIPGSHLKPTERSNLFKWY